MTETAARNELTVLDPTGDTTLTWDPAVPVEVDAARAQFNTLKAKRYRAYKMDASGGRGEVLDEFDARAARIIMVQPMSGG